MQCFIEIGISMVCLWAKLSHTAIKSFLQFCLRGVRWVTEDWPASDWWMTGEWPASDWWMTGEWPVSDRRVTGEWPVNDRWVIGKWLVNDRWMTDEWSESDWRLTGEWLVNDRWVTKEWPLSSSVSSHIKSFGRVLIQRLNCICVLSLFTTKNTQWVIPNG